MEPKLFFRFCTYLICYICLCLHLFLFFACESGKELFTEPIDFKVTPNYNQKVLQVLFEVQPKSGWSYQWGFGDGTFGEGAVVVKAYNQSGEYEVTLSWKSGSAFNSISKKVAVFSDTCIINGVDVFNEFNNWSSESLQFRYHPNGALAEIHSEGKGREIFSYNSRQMLTNRQYFLNNCHVSSSVFLYKSNYVEITHSYFPGYANINCSYLEIQGPDHERIYFIGSTVAAKVSVHCASADSIVYTYIWGNVVEATTYKPSGEILAKLYLKYDQNRNPFSTIPKEILVSSIHFSWPEWSDANWVEIVGTVAKGLQTGSQVDKQRKYFYSEVGDPFYYIDQSHQQVYFQYGCPDRNR
jgi:hypothetical protein